MTCFASTENVAGCSFLYKPKLSKSKFNKTLPSPLQPICMHCMYHTIVYVYENSFHVIALLLFPLFCSITIKTARLCYKLTGNLYDCPWELVKHQFSYHKPSITVISSLLHKGYIKWSLSDATVITRTLNNGKTPTELSTQDSHENNLRVFSWHNLPHATCNFSDSICIHTQLTVYKRLSWQASILIISMTICFMKNAQRKYFWAFNKLNSLIKLMCTLPFGT
jgi:hypothetical protein